MKTTFFFKLSFTAVMAAGVICAQAQVTGIAINDNNASADASAMLDINVVTASSKKGLLIPRVTTTQRNAISSPATSLLLYNTTTARFEYYTGSSWQPISSAFSGWALTGNSGTSSSNFVGTTDGQPLTFKINNTQAGYLGLSGSSYATAFGVSSNAGFKSTAIGAEADASSNNEAVAVGYDATGAGYQSVALGAISQTSGNNTIAIGYDARATVYQALAIGAYSRSSDNQNIAIGVSANSSGYQSTAIGNATAASAQNSMALGNGASVSTANYISIGNTSIQAIRGQVNFTTYSDGRFKKNVSNNVPGLSFINRLQPVTYTWDIHQLNKYLTAGYQTRSVAYTSAEEQSIADKEKIHYTGFIAQQVQKAAEEAGFDFSGVLQPKNSNDIYSLSYAEFVVPLVKAVQELSDKNQVLEARLKVQQSLIEQLAQRLQKLETK